MNSGKLEPRGTTLARVKPKRPRSDRPALVSASAGVMVPKAPVQNSPDDLRLSFAAGVLGSGSDWGAAAVNQRRSPLPRLTHQVPGEAANRGTRLGPAREVL